jgi:hypothetical protein
MGINRYLALFGVILAPANLQQRLEREYRAARVSIRLTYKIRQPLAYARYCTSVPKWQVNPDWPSRRAPWLRIPKPNSGQDTLLSAAPSPLSCS